MESDTERDIDSKVKLADVNEQSCYRVLLKETRQQALEHVRSFNLLSSKSKKDDEVGSPPEHSDDSSPISVSLQSSGFALCAPLDTNYPDLTEHGRIIRER